MTSRHGYLYQYEHRILPGLLFQSFDWFTSLLADGSEAFTFLLHATEVALGAEVPRNEQVDVSCVRLEGDCHLALFVFPPPVKSLEAYYAAAVWSEDGRIHRYLVLETSQDGPPYLAEWLGNGSRLNWGPMEDLERKAFLRQVIQTLYQPGTRPERYAPGDPADPFPLLPLLKEGLRQRKAAAIADLPANTGREYLARARAFASVQAYEQALADAQSARVLLPGNLQALIVEAEILSDLGQLEMAEPFFLYYLKRVGSDPTEPGLRLGASVCHVRLAELQRRAELYPRALQHANEAIRLRECSQAYLGRALVRKDCNDQQGAMEDVRRAMREDPRNPRALELRARLWADLRHWRPACADLERLLVLEPDNHRARFCLAACQDSMRRPDLALVSLQILTRVCPELPGLYERRGAILLGLDRHQEALEDFDEALRRNPKSLSVRRRRALALLGLEQHEAGLSELNAILEQWPDYAEALATRAQLQLDLGSYAEAETDLSRLLDPLSCQNGVFAWRALARIGLGRFEAAVEDWLRLTDEPFESSELHRAPENLLAVGNLPDTPAGNICAAYLHLLARRPGAVKLANRAVQEQPDDWRWRWLRAEILERSGQLEAAREDYAVVLSLKSEAGDASRRLAWCTLRAGRASEALEVFQEQPEDLDARLGRASAELALAGSKVEPLEALLGRLDELVSSELAAPAQALRGEALHRLGRPVEALQAYHESLRLSPSVQLPTLLGFARALLETGHPEDAIHCLREALGRDDTPDTRSDIAACLLRMGEAAEALLEAREALARFPDFAQAHLMTGRALVALGRPKEALHGLLAGGAPEQGGSLLSVSRLRADRAGGARGGPAGPRAGGSPGPRSDPQLPRVAGIFCCHRAV